MQRVLLLGLEQSTAAALKAALPSGAFEVCVLSSLETAQLRSAIESFRPTVICAPANSPESRRALQAAGSRTPFIAVSSKPNPKEWLEALQGGASDYFGPPFEQQQVGWVLQSATNGSGMPTILSLSA